MSTDNTAVATAFDNGHSRGVPLRTLVTLVVLVLFLTLGMGRGHGIWMPTLPATLLCPLAILLMIRAAAGPQWRLGRDSVLVASCFAVLCLYGAISALANSASGAEWLIYLSAYVAPLVVFLVLQDVQLDDRQRILALVAMSLGSCVPLGRGLVAYYNEWGIPSGLELLTSRFYQDRMLPYMDATFGNVNSTAAYLALLIPPLVYVALHPALKRWQRAIVAVALLLALLNVLIVQARTLFLVVALTSAASFWYLRVRAFRTISITLIAVTLLIQPLLGALDTFVESFSRLAEGGLADESAFQRAEAIGFGWRTMLENPLAGVGPGRTALVNPYTSAHQYWVQQGSELGVAGFLAATILSLAVVAAFVRRLLQRPAGGGELSAAFLFGAASYVFYAILANVPVGEGLANPWIGLFSAYLGIAVSAQRPVDSQQRTTEVVNDGNRAS